MSTKKTPLVKILVCCVPDDGSLSKQELDNGWRQESFPHPQNAPLYFHELDVVHNDAVDPQDFPPIFRLFGEDGNGAINEREARYNWNAYFSD
nr:DEC-3 [Biomphalaria glabrata]